MHQIPVKLLRWYDENARSLPWRSDPTPYKVWISEIMLQHTQVETVIPYFQRFIQQFPDLPSLAQAHESEVLQLAVSGCEGWRRFAHADSSSSASA